MSLWWQQMMLVMLGGALGAAGRFWLGGSMLRQFENGVPWGTLAANLGGAFAAGFLAIWLESRGPYAVYWRAFLLVGMLGALTTYSTLMLECMLLVKSGRPGVMLGYLGATLMAGLALVWVGAHLANSLDGSSAIWTK
ncbi:MAG: CrcB family protein [Pseudomonadota bacterium]|nr:CrcB family protein [Pseudomonadota bacterium]